MHAYAYTRLLLHAYFYARLLARRGSFRQTTHANTRPLTSLSQALASLTRYTGNAQQLGQQQQDTDRLLGASSSFSCTAPPKESQQPAGRASERAPHGVGGGVRSSEEAVGCDAGGGRPQVGTELGVEKTRESLREEEKRQEAGKR